MQAGGDDNTLEGDFIRRGIEAELLVQVRSQTFRLRGEFGNERFKIWDLGFWNWDLVLASSSFGRKYKAELLVQVRSQTFRLRGEFGNERGKISESDLRNWD